LCDAAIARLEARPDTSTSLLLEEMRTVRADQLQQIEHLREAIKRQAASTT